MSFKANVLKLKGVSYCVSYFSWIHSSILAWLKDHGLHTEGLFRKAGSAARQKAIRAEIEAAETFVMATSGLPLILLLF